MHYILSYYLVDILLVINILDIRYSNFYDTALGMECKNSFRLAKMQKRHGLGAGYTPTPFSKAWEAQVSHNVPQHCAAYGYSWDGALKLSMSLALPPDSNLKRKSEWQKLSGKPVALCASGRASVYFKQPTQGLVVSMVGNLTHPLSSATSLDWDWMCSIWPSFSGRAALQGQQAGY